MGLEGRLHERRIPSIGYRRRKVVSPFPNNALRNQKRHEHELALVHPASHVQRRQLALHDFTRLRIAWQKALSFSFRPKISPAVFSRMGERT
jgi:hypothetical protein